MGGRRAVPADETGLPRSFPSSWPGAVAHAFVATLDDRVAIDGPDGHHLARVRRLRAGEVVTLADGVGAWRAYAIVEVGPPRLRLDAISTARVEPRPDPGLAVAFALLPGDRADAVVQGLTELGVDRILPTVTRRSVVLPADRVGPRLERWRRVARSAAAQARRARLPEVAAPAPLATRLAHPALVLAAPAARLPGGSADPPRCEASLPIGGEWLLLLGPEGGFDPDEQRELRPVGTVTVGPHVLRAETAAVAATSALTVLRHP